MAMAAVGLALTLARLWHQESIESVTRVALDGLGLQEVAVQQIDLTDRPAMAPSLAWTLEPRANPEAGVGRVRRGPVQTFGYEVRDGETLHTIRARFATDVTVLQMRSVRHLGNDGGTQTAIAERGVGRIHHLPAANALDRADQIATDQAIVAPDGDVSMPAAVVEQPDQTLLPAPPDATIEGAVPAAAPPAPQADTRDTDLPAPPDAPAWQADVILSYARGARESQRKSGVPASVTIAQAILESDWGRSRLATEAKNLFGIKAFGRPGTAGIYTAPTWEVYGGQNTTVLAAFRAYNTLEDSIEDHGNWFHDNSRYWPALAVKDDPRAFARAIHAAGYATDPAYAPKLIALMDRFNLYQYDIQPYA
jgi:flagellum-specific peptidoglycan hydrolase FlgJ